MPPTPDFKNKGHSEKPERKAGYSECPKVRPISYLKNHAAELARDIAKGGEPMLITQRGRARLVVMDADAYQKREQSLALLKILAMGNRDIEQGRMHDAESVFEELEKLDQSV